MSEVFANGLNVNVTISPSDDPDAGNIVINILPAHNGEKGENGATFTPTVSENGILSWSNDKGFKNPDPVSIKGKSAYEIAVENGFEGTEEEWLNKTVNNVSIVQCKISEDDSLMYADKTQEEVRKAVSDGKAVIMVDAEFGFTSLYMGEGTVDGELCPVFVSPLSDEGQTALFSNYRYLKKTGEVIWRSGAPINQLTINYGDERYTFDGSQPTGVDIKDDVFIVRVNASGKADKTQAETIAALQNGKAALMIINGGEIYTYAIMSAHPSFPSVLSPLFISPITGDFGGDKYRTIAYLLPNNTVVKNTELLNTSGGGTGGTIEIPTADEILQTLIDTNFLLAVTDADGAILTDSDGAILMM